MSKFFSLPVKTLMVALAAFVLNGCSDDPGGNAPVEEAGKYSAVVCVGSWPNTAYYIADVPSLTSGQISLQGNGAEMTGKVYAQDIIQRNGFYYHANAGSGRFGKYHVEKGALVVDKEVPFTHLDWSSFVWIDDATLVVFGSGENAAGVNEARYAIVKVVDMSVTLGKLAFQAFPSKTMDGFAIGFAEYRDGKIFVGYSFATSDFSKWPVVESIQNFNVAVVNASDMAVESNIFESRSSVPGGPIVYAPVSFQDESGDIYFITDPVYNYDYKSHSAVYRIKKGATTLDNSYYLDFSAKTSNGMGAAMWYIGNGKAIVRTRVAGESIDAEHSFSIIDAKNGTFLKKLDLPADKGERMVNAVVREDDKVYIAVNAADKDYIWEYDTATEKLTPGAEFVGGIDYILRLEKTK
ncbi:DUF4374 domain-containing protein [Dyadobacter sp. CY351]|uniref:DUF4374 domain-containing protein n=1 Tax=Dyadobacter sp. CY351 TaxID=2909337 RepID=UPI001F45731A|nr:DUF4374 domain-containing protein [Dyadobacter sp. CY351]MCF2517696.1 DUF4374 domain-containing protein [Dyadobacter sp. CY351]